VANIDPRLIAQINNASKASNEEIKAVISLVNQAGNEKIVNDLLSQTQDAMDEKPTNVKHLPKLGVLVVQGSPKFIQKLLEHPEVSSATVSDSTDIDKQK
jgi:hypothetical protein